MNITRRTFIEGVAGLSLLESRRVFAVPAGAFAVGTPNLTFGVLSDVHVALEKGGSRLNKTFDTRHLEKAFAYFRDHGADAVVIAGDLAHHGLVGELKAVADAWFRIFPGDKAPDGRTVERVFVFGNHDWSGMKRGLRIYTDSDMVAAQALRNNPAKAWETCFHEEWREFYRKEVKGYSFVGAHWCLGRKKDGDCSGRDETFIAGLDERYETIRKQIDPSKPFFHVQHPHPKGTVHGDVWGQDDGSSTRVLSTLPNAVSFSGHSHTTLLDERSVWQGGFTAIGCGTLRNIGPSGIRCGIANGFENYTTPEKGDDALKMMACINRYEGKQGQLVRVYSDRIVVSRRDFTDDVALMDDLLIPLPTTKSQPFAFAPRAAAAKAPQFRDGAVLTTRFVEARPRGAKKGQPKKTALEIVIPPADAVASARCVRYEISAPGRDGQELKVAVLAEGFRFAAGDRRVSEPAKCLIARDRLSAGTVTVAVRAFSSWDKASEPLTTSVTL